MAKRTHNSNLLLLAILASFLLYLGGVFSGLLASKLIAERTTNQLNEFEAATEADLALLRNGTENELTHLTNYVRFLESNMNTLQLREEFLETLPLGQRCGLTTLWINDLERQLQYYREKLPYRLEEYERDTELPVQYRQLKAEYHALSLRTWIFAREQRQQCETALVEGIYFYNSTCDSCVRQGEELDRYTSQLREQGVHVMLFTVDAAADEPFVRFVREYYNVTQVPALVIRDSVFQGDVMRAEELTEAT